ncbi:hypothetical protein BH23ACT11_BH23ACT11_07100 [soil metagenome]
MGKVLMEITTTSATEAMAVTGAVLRLRYASVAIPDEGSRQ